MKGPSVVGSIIPNLILDAVLPTVDSVLNLILILRWYTLGHVNYASALAVPFIINSVFNIYQWWKFDSKTEKKFTWLLVVLQLWPAYKTMNLILRLYNENKKTDEEKRKLKRPIRLLQPYLESVPSLFVLFVAIFSSVNLPGSIAVSPEYYDSLIGECIILFWTKLSVAFLTSSLTLSTYLLQGPCKVIPNNANLNGMVSWKYLMAFVSTLFSLCGKLSLAAYLFISPFAILHSFHPTEKLLSDANQTFQSLDNLSETPFNENYLINDSENALVREIYKREIVEMSSEEMLKSKLYNMEMMMSKYNFSVYGFNYDDIDDDMMQDKDIENEDYSGTTDTSMSKKNIVSVHSLNSSDSMDSSRTPKSLNVSFENNWNNKASAQTLNISQDNLEAMNSSSNANLYENVNQSYLYFQSLLMVFAFIIVPQIFMAFSAILYITRCGKTLFKVLCCHPRMWLLPISTYFTYGPGIILHCTTKQEEKNAKLAFSRFLTMANIFITLIFFILGLELSGKLVLDYSDITVISLQQATASVLMISIPGIITTIIFLGSCNCDCKLEARQMNIDRIEETIEALDQIWVPSKKAIFHQNNQETFRQHTFDVEQTNKSSTFQFSRRQTL